MEAQAQETAQLLTDLSVQSALLGEEMQALNSPQRIVLTPPYDGGYLRKSFTPGDDSPLDSADRQYPNRGEIVAQLWNKKDVDVFGWIESGLWRQFKAEATGQHRVLIRIDAGPITQRNGAWTFVRALMPGLKSVYGSVASNSTSYLAFTVNLVKGQWYRLFVMGGVNLFHRRFAPPAYGEIIATFPRITVVPTAYPPQEDPFDAQLQKALADHDSPAAAAAALQANLGEGVIDIT